MKKICLIMALLLVLLLASCGKNAANDPTGTSETVPESTVSAEEAGFTLEDVVRANEVRMLINSFGGVQATRYEGEKMTSDTYFFMYAGKVVSTCCETDADGKELYSCTVDNERYDKVGDHLQFTYNLQAKAKSEEDYPFDDAITGQMMDGAIRWIEAPDEKTWRFELRNEEQYPGLVCRCIVARESLLLSEIDWDYGEGGTARIEIKRGADVMTKEFGLLDGFAKTLRTVTCVSTLHDAKGKETAKTVKVEVPYNVEPVWSASGDLNVYLNKDLTKAYKYPGNGEKDYTVYVTDAMG